MLGGGRGGRRARASSRGGGGSGAAWTKGTGICRASRRSKLAGRRRRVILLCEWVCRWSWLREKHKQGVGFCAERDARQAWAWVGGGLGWAGGGGVKSLGVDLTHKRIARTPPWPTRPSAVQNG